MTTINHNHAAETACDKFINGLGNGRGALDGLASLFEAVSVSGDTTQCVRAIQRAKRKGDQFGEQAVRFMMGQVFPGFKTEKDGEKFKFKTAKIKPVLSAVQGLRKAADANLSIRSSAWKKSVKPMDDDTPREAINSDNAPKLVEKMNKARTFKDMTPEEMLALAHALETAAKVAKAAG